VDLYIHFTIRLYGVVLNYLSTGTTLLHMGLYFRNFAYTKYDTLGRKQDDLHALF
jgi:hypothetical protein